MKPKPVIVKQMPEHMNFRAIEECLREIGPILRSDQPRLVFDFCHVRQMDSMGVEMLLHCMEEVVKRDGDLKLAAVPAELAVILELTRVDRLFEVYETTSDAVESFYGFRPRPPDPGVEFPATGSASTGKSGKANGHFKLAGEAPFSAGEEDA
jgi:anti-anti-sigma factor